MKYRIFVLVLLASAVCGCGTRQSSHTDTTSGPGFTREGDAVLLEPGSALLSKVQQSVVQPQDVAVVIKATASVGPKSGCVAEIGLPFGGRVVRSFVRLGDAVRRGQALFEVSSSDYMETVKTYLECQSAADLSAANRQRKEVLHQSGMLSDREWEEICAEARNAANAAELARRSLSLFQVDPASVQVGEPLRVVSPISGHVVRNDLVTGAYLAADDAAPMTVADLSVVWVTANLKPSQADGIRPGQTVKISLDPEHDIEGRVFYVGEMLDERTRTLPLVVECDNASRLLKPGMFVTVILDRRDTGVLLVPASAVFQGENAQFVYLRQGPLRFRKTPVVTESVDGQRLRVLSGVSAGDTILVDGGIYLSE